MPTVSEKRCSKCDEVKPVAEFFRRSYGGDGFQNYCKACSRAKRVAWVEQQPREVIQQYDRKTYQKHREVRIEKVKAYYRADPARGKARSLAWTQKHPEKVRAARTSWAKRNPDLIRHYCRQRRAWREGAPEIPFTAADLEAKFAFWGYRCWQCGGEPDAVDHVKPISKGGAHAVCNLRPICTPCNTRKKDRWPI